MTWRERFERARANGRLMDVAQVAELVGMSQRSVEELTYQGIFGAVYLEVDGELYFPTEAFKRHEDEHYNSLSEIYGASEEAEQNAYLN